MNIQGLQKLTLLDYPGHVACTIFTGGCQLNCPYCHNSELLRAPFPKGLDEEEVFNFLKKRQGILDGVCITGGEPLLQRDIESFLQRVKSLGYKIKLDTNGGFPHILKDLLDAQLIDYVAMDIKHTPDKYGLACGIDFLDIRPFEESKVLLLKGYVDYEFRSTIVKNLHTKEDLIEMARWIQNAKCYFLQTFVDREQVRDHSLEGYSEEDMKRLCESAGIYVPNTTLRGL